jgi:acylphosphatase
MFMKKAAKFTVHGTVQGVFYRQFVKENADALDLKGHVRNMGDGNVEVFVEGKGDKIDALEVFLNKGPEHSQIRHIEREEKKWSGDFREFKVIRF